MVAADRPVDPVAAASAAGFAVSGWMKLGDGRWRGHITAVYAGAELDLELEELAGSWRCVNDGTAARTLEQLLQGLKRRGMSGKERQ